MNHSTVFSLLVAACLHALVFAATAVTASEAAVMQATGPRDTVVIVQAPPSHPHPAPPPPVARVLCYSEPGFRGECLVVEAGTEIADLAKVRGRGGMKWDDRIASVLVEGPAVATLYADPRFRGERIETRREIRDLALRPHGETGLENWGRRASSLKVAWLQPPQPGQVRTQREADKLIDAVYQDLLGREPDYDGRQNYRRRLLDERWSEGQLRAALRRSGEFRERNVEALVRRAYREELGREPDAEGLRNYTRAARERGWSLSELRTELRNSPEVRERLHREIVVRAYRDLLGREPDDTGLRDYLRRLREGWSEKQVRDSLRASEEFKGRASK